MPSSSDTLAVKPKRISARSVDAMDLDGSALSFFLDLVTLLAPSDDRAKCSSIMPATSRNVDPLPLPTLIMRLGEPPLPLTAGSVLGRYCIAAMMASTASSM